MPLGSQLWLRQFVSKGFLQAWLGRKSVMGESEAVVGLLVGPYKAA